MVDYPPVSAKVSVKATIEAHEQIRPYLLGLTRSAFALVVFVDVVAVAGVAVDVVVVAVVPVPPPETWAFQYRPVGGWPCLASETAASTSWMTVFVGTDRTETVPGSY